MTVPIKTTSSKSSNGVTIVTEDYGGHSVIRLEMGRVVVCDFCNDEYTDSDAQGGILFGSYAVCPKCMPKLIADAAQEGTMHMIRAKCPEGKSFSDWVREDLR